MIVGIEVEFQVVIGFQEFEVGEVIGMVEQQVWGELVLVCIIGQYVVVGVFFWFWWVVWQWFVQCCGDVGVQCDLCVLGKLCDYVVECYFGQ